MTDPTAATATTTTTTTVTPSNENGNWQRTIDLPTGCKVRVDETRSLVELPIPRVRGECGENAYTYETATSESVEAKPTRRGWKTITASLLNGGMRSFASECKNDTKEGAEDESEGKSDPSIGVRVFNLKTPTTYDGLNPEPKAMLRNAIQKHDGGSCHNVDTTVGIMTAASMRSLRTASRSAGGVVVDAIVTAGIGNSRTAGAAADFFGILPPEAIQSERPPPGTINTVVVINGATLTPEAMVEAYAITVEAKCGACADYFVACAKNTQRLAQGTGTDCAVLMCPSLPLGTPPTVSVSYAGKHCLLAELIGQAVREATSEAILTNLHHVYGEGSLWKYHVHRCLRMAKGILEGARPCVPAKPMDPVPKAPSSVLGLGIFLVLSCYWLNTVNSMLLPRSATILVAAAAWDRCLPEPPLTVHPVVLAGTMISLATKQWLPEKFFGSQRPLLGFCAGVAFMVGTLLLFVSGAHVFVSTLRWADALAASLAGTSMFLLLLQQLVAFGAWVLEVVLFKTTFSLQLLCTIALQMAGFLERSQLYEARAQLSWLCSRDPTHLNSEELAGGTLESLSENLSDGTVAPWFWYVLFGPVGALGYRVANTLDSRIGYRGGRYEWFGKASARFDDLINLVPARLTALLLCAAAKAVPGCSPEGGLQTVKDDRNQCSSPNAGWPMGAMAGILGVRLEKKGEYCLGKSVPGVRDPNPRDIRKGHKVAQLAGGLALVTAFAACGLREWMVAARS